MGIMQGQAHDQTTWLGLERDAELAQLRATVAALAERLAQVEAGQAASGTGKRPPRAATAARPPRADAPATSRRGLLKRFGTSAAGAAVAATALGATRPD